MKDLTHDLPKGLMRWSCQTDNPLVQFTILDMITIMQIKWNVVLEPFLGMFDFCFGKSVQPTPSKLPEDCKYNKTPDDDIKYDGIKCVTNTELLLVLEGIFVDGFLTRPKKVALPLVTNLWTSQKIK